MRLGINEGRAPNRQTTMQGRGQTGNNPPSFGSARSDYGNLAYGGRLNKEGFDRGWWDKTADEVSSWLGDEQAAQRRQLDERRERIAGRDRGQFFDQRQTNFYPIESAYYPANVYERDWHSLRAGDVMTTDVVTVAPNHSVQFAALLMRDEDCGALPVIDRFGRMIGMITDRDIAVRLVADGYHAAKYTVSDCMTTQAFACHFNDSLENCMRLMSRHQIRRLPIVDDRNRVVGIISQADIAQHASVNSGTGERRAVSDVLCAISEPSSGSYT